MLVDNIKKHRLNPYLRYSVRDTTRCKMYECILFFQTDFLFLFVITDPNVLNNKICISKVDYYLNSNLINTVNFPKRLGN